MFVFSLFFAWFCICSVANGKLLEFGAKCCAFTSKWYFLYCIVRLRRMRSNVYLLWGRVGEDRMVVNLHQSDLVAWNCVLMYFLPVMQVMYGGLIYVDTTMPLCSSERDEGNFFFFFHVHEKKSYFCVLRADLFTVDYALSAVTICLRIECVFRSFLCDVPCTHVSMVRNVVKHV